MSEQYQEESVAAEPDAKTLAVVGGFVGTVLGSRRGAGGAVVGGFVGGTLGYLAGAAASPPEGEGPAAEPVVVTVDGTDDEDDTAGEDGEGDTAEADDDTAEDEDSEGEDGEEE